MTIDDRPLRADAERNRRRILAAARQLFAARGLGVSLDEIAAEAGVGVGTVYRRFPDRDLLIDALFEERIDEIAQAARDALEHDDPWEGFAWFLHEAAGLQAPDRGLVDFPAVMDGEEVYLCWLLDEPAVDHWHSIEAGFAGRRPLAD